MVNETLTAHADKRPRASAHTSGEKTGYNGGDDDETEGRNSSIEKKAT